MTQSIKLVWYQLFEYLELIIKKDLFLNLFQIHCIENIISININTEFKWFVQNYLLLSNIYCIPCFEYSYKSIHLMNNLIINFKEEILEKVETCCNTQVVLSWKFVQCSKIFKKVAKIDLTVE